MEKNKYLFKSFLIAILLFFGVFCFSNLILNYNSKQVDCNKPFDVIYLKPSETKYTSDFLDTLSNGIVVFPEINRVNAKTTILECDNFHYDDYLNNLE